MKYSILIAVAACAFLAQADAKSVFGLDFGHDSAKNLFNTDLDRGAIADALKEKLIAAKAKLDEMLTKAHDTLKEKLAEAKESAEKLIEQLKQKASEIGDKVFVTAHDILDKVSELEDKLVEQAKNILSKNDISDSENEIEID